MAVAEKDKPLVRASKAWFDWAVEALGVANADILNLTTIRGTNTTTALVAMIGAKTCAEKDVPARRACQQAMIIAESIGVLTTTNVAAANTVAGMRALWNAQDSSLSATLSDRATIGLVPIGAYAG